ARVEVRPPASIGRTSTSPGVWTGQLVGATLAAAKLLHPPGPIDQGTVRPGSVGLPRDAALDVARTVEEVELGFLYETQEGRIGFEARGARSATTPAVVFSDQPGAQFGYSALELGDWRRDIINRVTARLAPGTPGLHIVNRATADAPAGSAGTVYLDLPDASDGAEPGDLLLVVIASTVHAAGQEWETPPGWKEYRGDLRDAQGRLRIYAKKLEETDLGTTVTFYTDTAKAGGAWEEFVFHVKNWYGDIEQGVVVSDSSVYGPPNSAHVAANGINTPPVVFPDWGPEVSLFVSIRAGMHNFGPVTVGPVNDDIGPPGYGNVNGHAVTSPAKPGAAVAFQWAVRDACVEVEEPGPWASGSDTFGGFLYSETVTIAGRGFCGDPPEVRGGQEVEVNDVVSQRVFDAILPHANPAELFATVEDAEDYCRAVLVRHATERPLLSLTF